ncbi:MAG TPA: hypothetical protein EYQ70_03610 [Marine Group III euryarchaeote]|uniref:DoxX family protein n=1 Tax=Marine Group III euryarchaeote TaxID=2173149 RepID=A0A7J4GS61_9ARCH|nr:hypothetical protein [Marine Group III euryarchaeote]
MDAIKQYMKPKWWLIVIGALGVITGVVNFATAEDSAEMGWGEDYTANDVFYEKAWGLSQLPISIVALVSGLMLTGRARSIMAMTISGGFWSSMLVLYPAGTDAGYGFMEITVIMGGLFTSGYLHLEDEEE